MDAVFITERQIGQQVFEGMNSALGQQLRSLRTNALDHAYVSSEGLRGHDEKRSICERRLRFCSSRLHSNGKITPSFIPLWMCGTVISGCAGETYTDFVRILE